jgi:hypothetical protein
VFYLGGARSKVKPTIQNQSNYQVSFSYALTIEPGKTTSIIHGLAQRRLVSIPNPKAAAELFKPFHSRAWIRDLPRDVRRSIVNLGGYRFGGWGEGESFLTLESLEVDRQAADVLAIGDETRLHGTATCKALAIQTRYGDLTLPFEEVAALAGERYTGGRPRLFLRDGQVLNGQIDADGLQFALHSGLQLELQLENLDRLVMRSRADEAEPAEGVVAMLETVEGDRLALLQADDQRLAATTPWGDRQIGLDEIQRMFATEQKIGHHLVLRDGSRLFAFVGGSALTLRTLLFGVQPFTPVRIRRMTAVGLESSEQDNLLVGQVDVTAVHFVAGGQSIPVPPSQIRVLRNVTDEADGPSHQGPLFEADLWDGGTVRGELTELVLPIRAEDRVAQVPVHDVLEVRVPTPMVPDRLRTRIAQLIRDLGHAEYATRKAAKEALAELGHLPKLQLSETLKQTSDPEVRRSVEALLEELRE